MDYGFTITKQGWHLLAKLVTGATLKITRVVMGSGKVPEGVNPGEMTDLVQPVALATSTVPVADDRQVSFIVEYRSDLNGGLKDGFWLNEFGIFADDPDLGEVLLYYATLGDYPQYVSAFTGSSVDIRRYPVSIALSDCADVQLSYPANAWMTSEDVAKYCAKQIDKLICDMAKGAFDVGLTTRKGDIITTNDGEVIDAHIKLGVNSSGGAEHCGEGLFVLIGRMIDAKLNTHNMATGSHPDAIYAVKK